MSRDFCTISQFGDSNPRRVRVAGAQCSWELSNVGTFSGFFRRDDLRQAGIYGDLVGSWIRYTSPDAPDWGGVVMARPVGDTIIEINADGWGALLGAQVIDVWDRQITAPPAALARRALMLVGGDAPLFVTIGMTEEGGESVNYALGGQAVLDDALPELARIGELEWRVDGDRQLHVGRHLGRDLSAKVRLVEGFNVVDPDFADGITTRQPNRIYTIESDDTTAKRMIRRGRVETTSTVPVRVDKQITVLVRRRKKRGWRTQTTTVSELVMTTVTKTEDAIALPEMSGAVATWPEQPPGTSTHSLAIPSGKGIEPQSFPCRFTVINRNNLWREVDLGDVVKLDMGSAEFSGWFRLISASFDAAEGEMLWAGEALPDARTA